MRKILLLLMFLPLFLSAQHKFGYYSHNEVLSLMPEFQQAVEEFELLKQRCDAEIEHNEQELTRKYVAFLDGQQDFPEPILRKRQKELQQMVDNSVLFRDRLKEWLSHAKDSLFASCNEKIDVALESVCLRKGLAYAIDCDEIKYRYINPAIGEDISEAIIEEIQNPLTDAETPIVECAEDNQQEQENTPVATDVIVNAVTELVETVATDTLNISLENIVNNDSVKLEVEIAE